LTPGNSYPIIIIKLKEVTYRSHYPTKKVPKNFLSYKRDSLKLEKLYYVNILNIFRRFFSRCSEDGKDSGNKVYSE